MNWKTVKRFNDRILLRRTMLLFDFNGKRQINGYVEKEGCMKIAI